MLEEDEMFDVLGRTQLFDGDAGTLHEGARRALVRLIKEPYISAERNAADWQCVVECRPSIQSALNDLFLDLVIDERNELAYTVMPAGAADDFPDSSRSTSSPSCSRFSSFSCANSMRARLQAVP